MGATELQEAEDAEAEADVLAALGVLHHLAVVLPAAAPRAIADHPDAVPFLVACLDGKHKSDHEGRRRLSSDGYGGSGAAEMTEDLLGGIDTLPAQTPQQQAAAAAALMSQTDFEGGSEGDVAVRVGALRLLLDLATAPSSGLGGKPSIRQRVAAHEGLLEAVSTPLRRAAAAVAPPPCVPVHPQADEHVDLLVATPMVKEPPSEALSPSSAASIDLMPPSYDMSAASFDPMETANAAMSSSASSSPFGASSFAAAQTSNTSNDQSGQQQQQPQQQKEQTAPSWSSLPALPPQTTPSPPPPRAALVFGSAASVAEQALAVRILGELAGSDEATRFAILALPGCLEGAVALLASGGKHNNTDEAALPSASTVFPAALESMRASAARLVRNLTLSLVAAHVAQQQAPLTGSGSSTLLVGGFDLAGSGGMGAAVDSAAGGGASGASTGLTLALALGDGSVSVEFDVASLHATLVEVVVSNPDAIMGGSNVSSNTVAAAVDEDIQVAVAKQCAWGAAADCAWALRTLMAFGGGLELTEKCSAKLIQALERAATDAAGAVTAAATQKRSGNSAAVVEPLVGAVQALAQQPDAVPALVGAGVLQALGAVLLLVSASATATAERVTDSSSAGGAGSSGGGVSSCPIWLLAVEAALVLSAAAFHPTARRHPAMKPCLDHLRAAVRAASSGQQGGGGAAVFGVGAVLGPLADRALAACGHTPLAAVASGARTSGGSSIGASTGAASSSSGSGGGGNPLGLAEASLGGGGGSGDVGGGGASLKPLKVPGWTSGPANVPKPNPQQSPEPDNTPAVIIPSADSIAEFAAAASSSAQKQQPKNQAQPEKQQQQQQQQKPQQQFLNSRSPFSSSLPPPPPPPLPSPPPTSSAASLKWSESADEALARKLQEEDDGALQGRGARFGDNGMSSPPAVSSYYASPSAASPSSSSMVSDEEFARQLQERESGTQQRASFGGTSTAGRSEPPPPPLSSLGGYNPPPAPPSYGSI
jgi:hypothetical protein